MSFLRQDLLYTLRSLRKAPGFTLVAILTLALGIGANTAIFSVVNAVVLAPLPYHHPDQLVIVWQKNPQGRNISPSYPDFQDWKRNTHSFQDMAVIGWQPRDLTGPGSPEHLSGWLIGSGFFRTMGVNPILGRDFSPEEDQRGGPHVAIVSERVWKERFSSAAVLGKAMTMDGADYTIVGVVPSGINLGGAIDVYTPISQGDPLVINDRRTHAYVVIGRLKPGTSVAQANADTNTVEKNLGDLYPKFDQGLSTAIVPLKDALVSDVSGTLLMLLGSVGLVLLIACANVASLMLARAASREREFAIRAALGAKRIRIVWQMVAESLILSLAGGTLGLALARAGVRPLLMMVPGEFPRPEHVGLNSVVLLFTLGTSVVVGIVFGLIPAFKTWNANQQPSLQQGGRGSTSLHHRTQSSLVVVQTAMALVLLVGAGLLFRTIRHLSNVNPGFETHQLVSFKAALAPELTKNPAAMRIAYKQLIERIQGISGVQAADLTTLVPLSGDDNEVPFWLGEEPRSIAEAPRAVTYSVGPDYLRVMGIPLIRGRFFNAADTVHSEQVIVIDNALAEAYFPGRDPVGQSLTFGRVGSFRIIGVTGHVKHWGLGDTSASNQKEVYISFYQINDQWLPVMQTSATVMVRTPLDISALLPAIRNSVYGSGGGQPIYDVHTMQQLVSGSMATQNFPMMLLAAFAALALLLASVGIYAVISYSVAGRLHEIGIRMALGAERRTVFQMVIEQGVRLAVFGVGIGASAALLLARVLSSFSHLLYGVRAGDPMTLAIVSLVLVSTSAFACYLPASRATRVDPMIALRHE